MQSDDETLRLINSLESSEIRFFKLFSKSTGGEKKFLELFDLVRGVHLLANAEKLMESHPDLRQTLKNRKYLFFMILKSLRVYHSNKLDPIMQGMLDLELLRRKGLLDSALKMVNKLIAEAEMSLDLEMGIMLNMSYIGMKFMENDEGFFSKYGTKDLEENLELLENQHNFYYQQFHVHYVAAIGRRMRFGKNKVVQNQIQAVADLPFFKTLKPKPDDTIYSYFYNFKAVLASYANEPNEAVKYTEMALKSISGESKLYKNRPRGFSQMTFSLQKRKSVTLSAEKSLQMLESTYESLHENKGLPMSTDLDLFILREYISRKISYLAMIGGDESPAVFIESETAFLTNNQKALGGSYFKNIDYSLALYHLLRGQRSEAQSYLMKVFEKDSKLEIHLELKATMIEAMLYLDNNEGVLLINRIRSLNRLFQNEDPELQSGQIMIRFFRAMTGQRYRPEEEPEMIKACMEELEKAAKSYLGEFTFQKETGLMKWLENRLKKAQA